MAIETLVRMFYRNHNGDLDSDREDYTLEDLGGQIPNVGDIIVSELVHQGDNPLDPEKRTFCEVVRKYISPDASGRLLSIALEVKIRPGTFQERGVL